MSLQAKIEAVIYASEEPVTLAQLTGLLGVEAQAELDRMAERQTSLALDPPAEHLTADPAPDDEPAPTHAQDRTEVDAPTAEDGTADVTLAAKRIARDQERRLREYFRELLDKLIAEYATSERGIEIREVAGGFRMGTKPEYHDAVRGFVRSLKPALKLSPQALETLAVVAYKQPVTAPEITEIRGVDSGGVLGSLLARKLITTAGRKQVIGRPILYKTTRDFLVGFGLKDIAELPSIEEFQKMAGEFAEQEEIEMPERGNGKMEDTVAENLEAERASIAPQADGDSNELGTEESGLSDSNLAADDLPTIDGRTSGLPPSYDRPGDDPSADEARQQEFEGKA